MRYWKNNEDFFTFYLEKMEREIAWCREIIIKHQSVRNTLGMNASANEAQISQSGHRKGSRE